MTTSKLCDGWQARKVGPAGPTDPAYSRSAKPSPLGEGRLQKIPDPDTADSPPLRGPRHFHCGNALGFAPRQGIGVSLGEAGG